LRAEADEKFLRLRRDLRLTSPVMPLLAHRDYGGKGKPPLVVLHGLLGSARNWQSAGRDLAADFHVCALDLRNHGESFHAREMTYAIMADDVRAWLDARGWERVHLMGHSLGGKVAMILACRHPERVEKLVAVDIAPKAYPKSHTREFDAMHALEVGALTSRGEADRQLAPAIPDWGFRQFLLSNLDRRPDGAGFRWTINLPGLTAALPTLEAEFLESDDRFDGETLFVLGGKSRYFLAGEDEARVTPHFPRVRFETIPASGHNPHFETRAQFVAIVQEYLRKD
jgi:pimeloyl-ACP methyl ester carboxylesterase